MFIYFIAMLLAALIERRLRQEMEANGVKSIKSLPEDRSSSTPTWEQLVRLFDGFARHDLLQAQKLVKTFNDKTTEVQKLLRFSPNDTPRLILNGTKWSTKRPPSWRPKMLIFVHA